MATQIQLRRGTAADLYAVNPVLARGEPIFEIDTNKIKYGDGTTSWRDLPYANSDFSLEAVDGGSIARPRPGETGNGEFTPPNLSGLALWLDAADADFISLVDGKVSQWDDKSINKRSFFQSRAARRPAYSNTINTLGVVTFDNATMLASFELQPVFTLFVVLNLREERTNSRVFTALNSTNDTDAAGFIPCIANDATVGAGVGDEYFGAQTVANLVPAVYSATVADENFTTRLNGLTPVTNAHAINGNFINFALGASRDNFYNTFAGDIAEVVIYNRALSAGEYTQVLSYLTAKWGIDNPDPVSEHPLSSGMTAFWPLNEISGDRLDISGNNKTLTVVGDVAAESGVVNRGVLCSGGQNYLQNTTFSLNPAAFSLSLWFKSFNITGAPTVREFIQNWHGPTHSGQFVIGWGDESAADPGALWVYIRTTTGPARMSYTALAAGTWVHIVVTFDGAAGLAKLYANGALVDSANTDGALVTTIQPFQIGIGESGDLPLTIPCVVDSVGVWNRELPDSEIEMLYNAGFGKENFDYDNYSDNVELLLHMNKLPASGMPPPPATVGDEYFDNVSLLMHFDGSLTDHSANNNTQISTVGDAQISNDDSKFGGYSLSVRDVIGGGWLVVPNAATINFDTGAFTIEAWVKLNYEPPPGEVWCLLSKTGDNDWVGGYGLEFSADDSRATIGTGNGPVQIVGDALTGSTWQHVALTRDANGNCRFFIDGIEQGTSVNCADDLVNTHDLIIGNRQISMEFGSAQQFDGFIDELRVTKGVARYLNNFPIPSAAFPNAAPDAPQINADLVAFYTFDGLNDSTGNYTLVNNTGVTFTPGKLGSAATFDSTLQQSLVALPGAAVPTTVFSGAAWVYLTAENPQGNWIFSSVTGINWVGGGIDLVLFPDRRVVVAAFWGDGMIDGTNPPAHSFPLIGQTAVPLNEWHHIVGTFNATTGTARIYLDGVLDAEHIFTNLPPGPFGGDQTCDLRIGSNSDGSYGVWTGQIDALGLWNRELNAAEVALLYNAGAGTENVTGAPPAPITYFYDNSKNHYTVTATGGAQISNDTFKKYGNASGKFSADGDHLELPASAGDLGGSDFTVEFWCNPSALSDYTTIAGNFLNAGATDWKIVCNGSAGQLSWYTQQFETLSGLITTNAWSHVAFVRSAGILALYVNGVSAGSTPHTNNYTTPANALWIGHTPENLSGHNFAGHLDDFRITKGVARYSANFTPPDKEFADPVIAPANNNTDPYAEDVVLLLHFDGENGSTTFTDTSYVGHEVTANGAAVISTTQSKWGGASSKSSGTSGYLTLDAAAFNFGADNFTIEWWLYANSTANNVGIFGNGRRANTAEGMSCYLENGSNIRVDAFIDGSLQSSFLSGPPISASTWHHCAITRQGNTYTLWQDGSSVDTYVSTNPIQFANTTFGSLFSVAGDQAEFANFNTDVYLDDFRITKGVARYTGLFSRPTSAFPNPLPPAVAPALLMHFDSGAFVDDSPNALTINASTNPPPQLSSTQSRFGGKSGLFTADSEAYLTIADNPVLNFTGEFTVEFWVYPITNNGSWSPVSKNGDDDWSAGYGFEFSAGASLCIVGGDSGALMLSGAALLTGQWQHIALTRDANGDVRFFIDGELQGLPMNTTVNLTNAYDLNIGNRFISSQGGWARQTDAYIDELRIVNGKALYTATFETPTAAFTASFMPSDITGLDLWLDAKDSQFVTFNNTDVLTWSDKSAASNDASNVDYSPRPVLVSNSTPAGTAAVRFSGDPNMLEVQNTFNLKNSTGFVVIGQPDFTGDITTSRTERILSFASDFGLDASNADGMAMTLAINADNTGNNYVSILSQLTAATTPAITLPLAWTVASYTVDNDARAIIWPLAGGAQFPSNTANICGGNLYIGSNITADPNVALRADIAAVLHYDHKLGAGARAGVEKYLTNKFLSTPPLPCILLAHFDTTIADSSTYARTLTAHAGAALSNVQSKFGGSSVYFDGLEDYIEVSNPTAFNFAATDFTVEGWIYITNNEAVNSIFSQRASDASQLSFDFLVFQGSTYMVLSKTGLSWAAVGGGSEPVPNNQWVHVAYVRSGSDFYAFVNGQLSQTLSLIGALYPSTEPFRIGGNTVDQQYTQGYIDAVRVTKGQALYTANFTPPSEPFNP